MRIYIPSRGRFDERLLRSPAAQLPDSADVVWVVGHDEAPHYVSQLALFRVPGRVVPCSEQPNISAVRHWIGRHAALEGHDRFCMMDDDIGFLVRRSPDTWQLRATTPAESMDMVRWLERALDTCDHAGISAREGNNRAGEGTVETLVDRDTRMMRVLAYRTDRFLDMVHGRVRVMEDFDISLQLLRSGGSNAVSFWWAQGQRMTNEDGGCSVWRTREVHEESARRLAELHPGLVRLRQKQNKTDADGLGTRLEVTISWKRARAASGG